MPVPVVMQAGLELEPLSGEARVERLGSGQGIRRTPGGIRYVPNRRLGGVCARVTRNRSLLTRQPNTVEAAAQRFIEQCAKLNRPKR